MKRVLLLMLLAGLAVQSGQAAEPARFLGRSLVDVLDSFRADGLSIVYSTDLVTADLKVNVEPESDDPETILREILEPLGLALRRSGGAWLITPGSRDAATPTLAPQKEAEVRPPPPKLENVLVHASRYEVHDRAPAARQVLDSSEIDQLVATGREPLRAIGRLPGAASSGLSSRQNIRGGEEDEVLLVFDGVPLFEPFHLKDFQGVFSTLDPRVVGGMEVYTGSFPAQYGDRLSGVIDVVPQVAGTPHNEIGLDFFNAGILSSGQWAGDDGEWLVSARRGTLDLLFDVVQQDIGSPSYYDVLAQARRRVGPRTRWSASLMLADDAVSLNETDRETEAFADHRTLHAWTALEQELTGSLSHRTVLAYVDAENLRQGTVDRPDESLGDVLDRRRYNAIHLKQDWTYAPVDEFLARWGIDLRRVDARYRYVSSLQFFEDEEIAQLTGRDGRQLDLSVAPDGGQVGVYLTNRWRFASRWTAEVGLRWDRQSYVSNTENEQTSPRLSLMFQPTRQTTLRLGWGRFSQAQGVHELQVEDGVTGFFPAQRSAHTVLGLDHRFGNDLSLRAELYHKQMDTLRPRYENLFDKLELLPELSPDRVRLAPTEATARGVEVLLRMDREESPLAWWLGASLSSVKDRIDAVSVPRSWDQRSALNLGLNWRRGTWRADAVLHYHDGWPTTGLSIAGSGSEAEPVLGPRNAERLPDFVSLDMRISRRMPLRNDRALTLFFELSNALNRDNACCIDYGLEESSDGGLVVQREFDHWLPVVPSLGFIWEF